MSERFVIFTKPRVRDASGAIYAVAWDRELEIASKGTGRTTAMARRAAIIKAEARSQEVRDLVAAALSRKDQAG